jgi:SAM-dependent methyltransferase
MPLAAGRPYTAIAACYDEIFGPMRDWAGAARKQILGSILPAAASACDIACGTGETALELAARGIRMYAVDLSRDMCRLARAKARRARLPLRVLHADMRDFRLPEPVDLVLCEFDAINHIPRKSDLVQVARSAARALRPGGHFYFDANNHAALRKLWPATFWIEKPRTGLVMHGGYDATRELAWIDVEMFRREGRLWRRSHERVEEICWTAAEVRQSLRSAGFGRIRAWDAAPFFAGNPFVQRGYRTIYLAKVE